MHQRCTNCGLINEDDSSICSNCSRPLGEINRNDSRVFKEDGGAFPEKIELQGADILELENGVFEVKRKIGQGGFGSVFEISNSKSDNFAIKVLDLWKKKPDEWDVLRGRFAQGVKASKIKSTNLVKSYTYGVLKGNPYLIMEYCSNGNLSDKFSTFSSEDKFSFLAKDVLVGLNDLHSNGVIHRDIKPENILFDKKDIPKLTDFDISVFVDKRATLRNWRGSVKEVWGTAMYAPPEQLDYRKAYHATRPTMDIFSFGVTLYETITDGKYPFGTYKEFEKNPIAFYKKVRNSRPISIGEVRPDISSFWKNLIDGCIEPNPDDRIQTVSEILDAIPVYKVVKRKVKVNGNWVLKVMNGHEIGKVYDLGKLVGKVGKNLLTMGYRGDEYNSNNIGVQEVYSNYISSRHCTLEFFESSWFIRDGQMNPKGWLPSTNGTYVNSKKVDERGMELSLGDIITIGDTTLKLEVI